MAEQKRVRVALLGALIDWILFLVSRHCSNILHCSLIFCISWWHVALLHNILRTGNLFVMLHNILRSGQLFCKPRWKMRLATKTPMTISNCVLCEWRKKGITFERGRVVMPAWWNVFSTIFFSRSLVALYHPGALVRFPNPLAGTLSMCS